MARPNILEMTQTVLSRIGSDSVNSISDTVESRQVASLLKDKYYDIVSRGDLPEQEVLFQLVASTDTSLPILMYIPDRITQLTWVKYFDSNPDDSQQQDQFGSYSHGVNTDLEEDDDDASDDPGPGYKYVRVVPVDTFLDMVNRFSPLEDNVIQYTFSEGAYDFTLNYKNNHQPSFCTVLENHYVLFDMYDNTQDTTLQASKTMCYGEQVSNFEMSDTFVPDIDDNKFPLLLNEVTSAAFIELKQMPNSKVEQEAKRQWAAVQKEKSVSNRPTHFQQLPDFGRVPRTGGYISGGYGAYKWMKQT